MVIDAIIACLNQKRIRCTYWAVGEVIGCTALEVQDHLQDWNTRRGLPAPHRDPQTSWVINAGTGEPTGYTDPQSKHPDLHRDRVILKTGSELLALLKRCANPLNSDSLVS